MIGVTGIVMTKLDGTARGGVLVPVAQASDSPIKLIGVGEGIDDLQPFDARAFSRSLVGLDAVSVRRPSTQAVPLVQQLANAAPAVAFLAALLITHDFRKATWVLIALSALALALSLILERRIAPIPAFSGGVALVFGGLSLALHRNDLLQMKMTIVDGALGAALFGGLALKRNPLKLLLGSAMQLPDAGLAGADDPLRPVLLGLGDRQRDRPAHPDGRGLGDVPGRGHRRRGAVRRGAVPAAEEILARRRARPEPRSRPSRASRARRSSTPTDGLSSN